MRGFNTETAYRVLVYHRGGICVGTFGDECLCGWRGESWERHVASLLAEALEGPTAEKSGLRP
jgi:hypothetical protein